MKFSRISVTGKGVELDYMKTDGDAKEETKHSNHMPPLGSFTDALQGFVGYVVGLIPVLEPIRESLTITTLNLSEDKNGLRGVIVTALYPVEKAYNRPLVVNTPLVREGGELPLDGAFVLSDDVLKLIALTESEARRYKNKEYGELVPEKKSSENTKNASERMAAAEVASTRKPKGKMGHGKGRKPSDPEPVAFEVIRQLLLQVERSIDVEAIAAWTDDERTLAREWATARLEEMVGQRESPTTPTEPQCVIRASTLPLKADEWQGDAPPKVSDDAAKEIGALAGRAD